MIELKREKTPRDIVAQILKYASFAESLTYEQLEEIARHYTGGEGLDLTESHKNFLSSLIMQLLHSTKHKGL